VIDTQKYLRIITRVSEPGVMARAAKTSDAIEAPFLFRVTSIALVVMLDRQELSAPVSPAIQDCARTTLRLVQFPVVFPGKPVHCYSPVMRPALVIILARPAILALSSPQRIVTGSPGAFTARH